MSNERNEVLRLLCDGLISPIPFVRTKSDIRLDISVDPFREYVKKTLRQWVKIESILDRCTNISNSELQREALFNFYIFTKAYDPNIVAMRNAINISLEHGIAFSLLFFAETRNPLKMLSEVSDDIEKIKRPHEAQFPPQNRWDFFPRDVERKVPSSRCTLRIVEKVPGIRFNSMISKEYRAEAVLPTVQDLIDMMDFLEPEEQGILSTYLPSFAASEK